MRTTRITSALRSQCFEITLEGRTGGRGVAEQVDHLNHPPPISLGDHGYRSYRFLRSCKSGFASQPGGQLCRALEVEQGVRQGFQLLHW